MIIKFPNEVTTKDQQFKWLHENHDDILDAKKVEIKTVDIAGAGDIEISDAVKEKGLGDEDSLQVKVVINTTNIMDSHKDVHLPGIWNKTIKENKRIKHVQEHQMSFDKIIADKDDLKVSVKTMSWKDLGYDAEGKTQALIFDSTVKRSRNPFMFNQYKDDNVDNHSVAMIYVKLKMAMDSEEAEYSQYKEVWDEYIDQVVNRKDAKSTGYFWIVSEAKMREGSAVVDGSNFVTPTLSSRKDHLEDRTEKAEKSLSQNNKNYLEALKQIIN